MLYVHEIYMHSKADTSQHQILQIANLNWNCPQRKGRWQTWEFMRHLWTQLGDKIFLIETRTESHRQSFVPSAIRLLNSSVADRGRWPVANWWLFFFFSSFFLSSYRLLCTNIMHFTHHLAHTVKCICSFFSVHTLDIKTVDIRHEPTVSVNLSWWCEHTERSTFSASASWQSNSIHCPVGYGFAGAIKVLKSWIKTFQKSHEQYLDKLPFSCPSGNAFKR